MYRVSSLLCGQGINGTGATLENVGARPSVAGQDATKAEAIPDEGMCRGQLQRILTSPEFDASDRDRRFLAFVVEETLAGRADRIKAYSIAVEVFGRDSSFDPQSDPIVRVEAGHLRRALDRYCLGAGRADEVEITIPKGRYAPKFRLRPVEEVRVDGPQAGAGSVKPSLRDPGKRQMAVLAGAVILAMAVGMTLFWKKPPPTQPDLPHLLVQPFLDLSRTDTSAAITQGLTQEVVGQMSKFRDIVVIAADSKGNPPDEGTSDSAEFSPIHSERLG
jgi:hypothetical protein